MKQIKFFTLCLCLMTIAVLTPSCDDPCDAVNCQNGSTCVEGDCLCPDGVGGTECETIFRDALLGTHSANEVCGFGNDAYDVTVSSGASTNGLEIIEISNVYLNGIVVTAEMTSANAFSYISSTTTDGITITAASGTITGTTVTMTFTVTDGTTTDSCTLTFTV